MREKRDASKGNRGTTCHVVIQDLEAYWFTMEFSLDPLYDIRKWVGAEILTYLHREVITEEEAKGFARLIQGDEEMINLAVTTITSKLKQYARKTNRAIEHRESNNATEPG
jgi:hypothetical protein